jgi:hypothetical protein
MTKRFVDGGEECIEDQFLIDTSNDKYYWVSDGLDDIVKLLNELHEENKQIKDLIHTILNQINVENITSDSAIYSAKIIFSKNEFNLIRELWKRS